MRKPFFLVSLLFAGTLLFSGCKPKRPSEVIAPDVMENLLYDYHLAEVWSNEFNGAEHYKRELLQQFVFDKYGVDRAQFDSSMVWYTRNTKQLEEIYEHVGDRLQAESDRLGQLAGLASVVQEPLSGDTVNLWQNRARSFELTTAPLTNKITFTLESDTAFYPRDKFHWSFDAHYIAPKKGRVTGAMAELTVLYRNDSIRTLVRPVKEGSNRLVLPSDSFTVKEVRGMVYYAAKSDSAALKTLWLTNTQLLRTHLTDEEIVAARRADSLRAVRDTMKVDSALLNGAPRPQLPDTAKLREDAQHRLSPTERRKQEQPAHLQKKVKPQPHVIQRRR
jgi:hypothetical protein